MARSRLTNTTQDLITDSGSVLWSMVKGEQLEFPVTLNFVKDASVKPNNNYIYEAVVVEADNVLNQTDRPINVKAGGQKKTLFVRLPYFIGQWNALSTYNKEEVVSYGQKYYKLLAGLARTNSTSPDTDPLWEETSLSKIYIQFPANLIAQWSVQPGVDSPVYGFFELRVTEPTDAVFTRTFKPVRGMLQVLFSPTDETVDIVSQSQ